MPHITRFFVGSDYNRVLPISSVAGSIFVIWTDLLARTVFAPEEMPIFP